MTYIFSSTEGYNDQPDVDYCPDCGRPAWENWDTCVTCATSDVGKACFAEWEATQPAIAVQVVVVAAKNPCPACGQELGQNFFNCDICADSKEGELAAEIYADRLNEIDWLG